MAALSASLSHPATVGNATLGSSLSYISVSSSSPFNLYAKTQRRFSQSRCFFPLITYALDTKNEDWKDETSFTLNRRKSLITSALGPFLPLVSELSLCSSSSAAENESRQLEKIREAVRKVVTKAKAAGVLRLVFHDAGTFNLATSKGGMNGSVVLELDRPENQGLNRSVKVLSKVKAALEPDIQVSWADLIAVAGAEALSICGGPKIDVKLGRLDSSVPDPEGQLPVETLSGSQLRGAFQDKGFSTQELVALSGAHTVGGKGFGDPNTFDNAYYKILLQKPWLGDKSSMIGLDSDRGLPEDEECLKWVNIYAEDQDLFFQDFSKAYLKLVNTGLKNR
ncbi:hypothetical protein R1flu_002328 [Riccia fluitans]|uniref:L-ascorbate peroxidase n=1 Tax=Riccia fluitans TaxID=41844 RepID=A0ABD1Y5T1_9MARC